MDSNEFSIRIEDLTSLDLLVLMAQRASTPDDPLFVACHAEFNQRRNLPAMHQLEPDDDSWLLIEAESEEELEEFTEPTEEDWEEADRDYDHDQEATERSGWIDSRRLLEQQISDESPSGPEVPPVLPVTVLESTPPTTAPQQLTAESLPAPEPAQHEEPAMLSPATDSVSTTTVPPSPTSKQLYGPEPLPEPPVQRDLF